MHYVHYNANLKTLDLSSNVITDELAEQLAIVLANCTKLETLLLRDCSLSSVGIHVVAYSLKNITTLKQLSLSWDNITDVTTDYLVTVITCNVGLENLFLDGELHCFNHLSTAIEKLNLELLQIDYKVIDITCELVNSLINNSKLKYFIPKNHSLQVTGLVKFDTYSRNVKSLIVIRTTGQDPTTVKASVDESKITVTWSQDNILASTDLLRMVSLFNELTSISWLNLTLNDYCEQDVDEIVTMIASFTQLEEFVIGGYSASLQNCILNSLTKLINLRSLDLSCSRIDSNAATNLATILQSSCKIQELKLNFCILKSSQVTEIINALKTHTGMQSLCLYNNNITDTRGIAVDIGQVLLNNQCMQKFYIGNNRLKTRDITKILEVLKQSHKLNELLIGPYSILDDISDGILETRSDDFLAEVITNNPELKVLAIVIPCTCVHADGTAKVVTALKSLSCLGMLDISGNNINEESADDIASVFTNNSNLSKLSVADNYRYLGTAGISKIADALSSTTGLDTLDITNNNISSGAAESISKMITNNPQLKSLLLGREKVRNVANGNHKKIPLNNSKSCEGVSAMKLSNVFINIQMIVVKQYAKINLFQFFFTYCITLSSNFCRKLFSGNLALNSGHLMDNKLQSQGIEIISKTLATIKSLEVLSIENNDIDDQAADDIATMLTSNYGIKQLWIGQNKFTPSGISTILQPLLRTTPSDVPIKCTLEVLVLSHSNLSLTTTVSEVLSKNHNIQQLWLEGNNWSSQCITTII